MSVDSTFNETDIREEIVSPFLAALGYRKGTAADIFREHPLTYGRVFLGRKKIQDPPLRGRADYILSVTGAGRWIIEVKGPNIPITINDIEQAISYARHPEVSASYTTITNGRDFLIFHSSQRSSECPIASLAVQSAEQLAQDLEGLLSPSAIRRDCSPPEVDLNTPLASGLRSRSRIIGGTIEYEDWDWGSTHPLPPESANPMADLCRRLTGFCSNISGGEVWRDDRSRIRARLQWAAPHIEVLQFACNKGLIQAEYVSLSERISQDKDHATLFDVAGEFSIEQGESIFDINRWERIEAGIRTITSYRGQALGYFSNDIFSGYFGSEYRSIFPDLPINAEIFFSGTGRFEIQLE